MFRLIKMGRSFIILSIVVPIMTLVSFGIYFEYVKTKEDVFNILQKHLIDEKLYLFKNYVDYASKHSGQDIKSHIGRDEKTIYNHEQELRLLQGDEIKYLYLLYKDNGGKFRFLLDATSDINEKAEFNQKFDPQTDIWDKAYETKSVQTIQQKGLQELWVSIAYPVIIDDTVVAVLGADFTYDVYTKIVKTLKPMEKVFFYVNLFMIVMLMLAYILVYMYYKTRKKSFIDPLTNIYNRQYLSEFLEISSLKDYSLMMIDLDHFKLVNDNYGHDVGDKVLISVVQGIKSKIRKEDVLIRFGGEEFLLLVYKKDVKDSIAVAQRIRKTVMNSTTQTKNNKIKMTLSIGVNPYPYYAKNIEEAVKIADEQLYKAKSSGRNRIEVFDKNDKKQSQTSKRISDVQSAIDENRIKCAFQAIYSNKTKEIVKYEMLLRLIDKQDNIIAPGEFLPSIRNTQVYINLTRFVIDTAMEVLKEQNVQLTINLDLQDILNDDIIDLFQKRFTYETELAERLTIEILEHEEITNFRLIKERLALLKELGFKIALDDFGSGYANFRYLIDLDIDILKIDGSIIKDVDKDIRILNIVKTIIVFAKSMNMQTVAEQVETVEEFDVISQLDIDYIQGYYLSRPDFTL